MDGTELVPNSILKDNKFRDWYHLIYAKSEAFAKLFRDRKGFLFKRDRLLNRQEIASILLYNGIATKENLEEMLGQFLDSNAKFPTNLGEHYQFERFETPKGEIRYRLGGYCIY